MLQRAFTTKEKLDEFILKYVHNELKIQLILEILQPSSKEKNPAITNYFNFWNRSENTQNGLAMHYLECTVASFIENALKDKFGNPDFTLRGSRSFGTYILELDGLQFIVSTFREVILDGEITVEAVDKMIRFREELYQIVIDYVSKNYDKLPNYDIRYFDELKKTTLIDSNGKINYSTPDKKLKLKP